MSFLFTFLCRSSVCFHFVIPFSSLPQPFFLVPLPLTLVLTPLRCSLSRCPLPSPPVTRCHPSLPHLPLCTLVHPPTRLPTHSPTLFYLLTYRTEPPSPLFMVPPFYSIPSVFHMFPFCVLVTLHIISHHISILYFPPFFFSSFPLFFFFLLFSFSPSISFLYLPSLVSLDLLSLVFLFAYTDGGRARDRGLVSCVYVCIPFSFLFVSSLGLLFDCVIHHTSQTLFSFLHAYMPEDTETGRQRRRDSEVGRQMEREGGGGKRGVERERERECRYFVVIFFFYVSFTCSLYFYCFLLFSSSLSSPFILFSCSISFFHLCFRPLSSVPVSLFLVPVSGSLVPIYLFPIHFFTCSLVPCS